MGGIPLNLVYVGNQIQLQHCQLYDDHLHPMTEAHHVCPESWWLAAHKTVGSPLLTLCPNCHYSTHVAIDSIFAGHGVDVLPPTIVNLAQRAFTIAAANGLTPARTL